MVVAPQWHPVNAEPMRVALSKATSHKRQQNQRPVDAAEKQYDDSEKSAARDCPPRG
jgi:hypothetical protein